MKCLTSQVSYGVRHYYFRPSAPMQRAGVPRQSLGTDRAAAEVRAAELLAAWEKRVEHASALKAGIRSDMAAHLRKMVRNAKQRAIRRGVGFDLTYDEVAAMVLENDGGCAVTGLSFNLAPTKESRRPFVPSLDRLDNSQGYSVANCRVVCSIVNYAMGEWGEDALLTVAKALLGRHTLKEKRNNRERTLQTLAARDANGSQKMVGAQGLEPWTR